MTSSCAWNQSAHYTHTEPKDSVTTGTCTLEPFRSEAALSRKSSAERLPARSRHEGGSCSPPASKTTMVQNVSVTSGLLLGAFEVSRPHILGHHWPDSCPKSYFCVSDIFAQQVLELRPCHPANPSFTPLEAEKHRVQRVPCLMRSR